MKMKMFKPQSSTVNQPFFPTHEIHIKAKVKVLSALSFCHSHSISLSLDFLKYFSFILVLYQFVLSTLRDINILSSPRKIFLSSLTRKIFSFLSSHKYICSRNLSPWLSLTRECPDQDVTRPRVQTRVGHGVTEARSPVTELEPAEDTHDGVLCWAGH